MASPYALPVEMDEQLTEIAKRRGVSPDHLLQHILKEWLRFRFPPTGKDD